MSKWRVKENPAWGKMLDVVADDHNVAFFQREEDAARCVEAVNEVERLREALEKLARLGNEPEYGNSEGNLIARAALAKEE